MTLQVAFSAAARADLRGIVRFSVERFGPAVADGYAAGLRAACKRLGAFPVMAPLDPVADPPARVLVHRSHRIYYREQPARVLIVRILHHARDTPSAL